MSRSDTPYSNFESPTLCWAEFDPDMPPQPPVVVELKDDGDAIGGQLRTRQSSSP